MSRAIGTQFGRVFKEAFEWVVSLFQIRRPGDLIADNIDRINHLIAVSRKEWRQYVGQLDDDRMKTARTSATIALGGEQSTETTAKSPRVAALTVPSGTGHTQCHQRTFEGGCSCLAETFQLSSGVPWL